MRSSSFTAWLAALIVPRVACRATAGSRLPLVDLGYARYQGLHDVSSGLNVWKGIRYAAPPIGQLRWQKPQPPLDESAIGVIEATELPPLCPQAVAFGTPTEYGFNSGPGNEDCLYLNVYAPAGAKKLPVLVWIHGGGYSLFGARYDLSTWIKAGGRNFVAVEIQYRLGAFGFLASPEVHAKGQLNAGLLDQRLALGWVQLYIARFGGDPAHVTIAGESSGAGSVMHQALAHGGHDAGLFKNIYVSSPYLPPIYTSDDPVPMDHYQEFARLAGCPVTSPCASHGKDVFECLVSTDSSVLQNASNVVAATRGYFGSFAWLPVVDGTFINDSPVHQLSRGAVAGKRVLVGTNANEGVPLTNPRVSTKQQYEEFVRLQFPRLTARDRTNLATVYHIDEALAYGNCTIFDTTGDSGPTALVQSSMATGIQQAAFNIAAEATFHCPAQWLADAFDLRHGSVWKYQYSLTPSYHGADLSALFDLGPSTTSIAPSFRRALHSLLSAFVTGNRPAISAKIATGGQHNATAPTAEGQLLWPQYTRRSSVFLNLNTTGGEESPAFVTDTLTFVVRSGPGVVNNFRLADARTWEAGRAARCEFWKSVSERIPY
ncbi:Alpha/Beta hydrolase protein [Microdochium bolleyi]|uniref:Carboxylic ester hydrolase n=1 Tax=Microdochium bolleyi TaxID=196109 RepID=A0A136J0F6_9PEZI|nr:Alpha/Beta hydrolase protein [Microdochium bolleyi]